MAQLVALKAFSTKPEGKVGAGQTFETVWPEFFIERGYARVISDESGQTETPADDPEQDDSA